MSLVFLEMGRRSQEDAIIASGTLASAELTTSIADSRFYASRFAATGDFAQIDHAFATLTRAKERLSQTQDKAAQSGSGSLEDIDWLKVQVEGFEAELRALRSSVEQNGLTTSSEGLSEAIALSGELLADQARGVEAGLVKLSAQSSADLKEFNFFASIIAILLIAMGMAAVLLSARFLARHIAGSIGQITEAMTGLADGDDLVSIPGQKRSDEIGAMARALTVFRDHTLELAHLQEQAAAASRQELLRQEEDQAKHSAALNRLADKFEFGVGDVVTHVASASNQLHSTARDMANNAKESAQIVHEVGSSLNDTTRGVNAAAAATDQFAMSIAEIGRQAAKSAELARGARRSAENADSAITSLTTTADRANQLVELIGSIAQRTDLLALNATIEAARGGEAGRGFAVVASEVKELARQTQNAAEEVTEQIKAMQNSTHSSVEALHLISDHIFQVEENVTGIAQAVDEQSVASRDLARNLDLAAAGANAVNDQFERVRKMASAAGNAAKQLLESASGLHEQASGLGSQAQGFVNSVRTT
ncbi:HAMP domain-containing protein [Erythrobacteraceae bacterium E2-1 Yellow Sea]|nr:HAMP domain-containing protein [Erythrobacteraceae bacterium E2-1 Yellow Sea]